MFRIRSKISRLAKDIAERVVDTPSKIDGILQEKEVSRVVEWEVDLPPPLTDWDCRSAVFLIRNVEIYFKLCPDGPNLDNLFFLLDVLAPGSESFPLTFRWRTAVKRRGDDGLLWVMSGEKTVKGPCFEHCQGISIKRDKLPAKCLTFVHHLSIGCGDTDKEVSIQTDCSQVFRETQAKNEPDSSAKDENGHLDEGECSQVFRETQTENEPDSPAKDENGNLDEEEREELRQLFRLWLEHPEEGDNIRRLSREKFQRKKGKYLSMLPKEDKEPFISAA